MSQLDVRQRDWHSLHNSAADRQGRLWERKDHYEKNIHCSTLL